MLDHIIAFFKLHPWLMGSNVLLSLFFPLDDILVPYLTGRIVTLVQERKPWLRMLIALITVLIGMQLLYSFTFWHDAALLPRFQNFMRDRMVQGVIGSHETADLRGDLQTGELMSRLVKIPLVVVSFFERIKNYFFPYLVSFLVTTLYILYKEPKLGAVLGVCGLIVIWIVVASPRMCQREGMEQEASMAHIDEEMEDVLRNLPTVYTADMSVRELERLKTNGKRYERAYWWTTTCTVKKKLMAILVLVIMLAFFAWYSYTGVMRKTMSVGLFVTIFMILTQWYVNLCWVSSSIPGLVMDYALLEGGREGLLQTGDPKARRPIEIADGGPAVCGGLEVRGVTYFLPQRAEPLLDGVSLCVHRGERVAIVGPVGSGKSTLLKIIARLIRPDEGEVFVVGAPLSSMPLAQSRALVGYVQQQPALFNRTIYENVSYGNSDTVTREVVNAAITELGLGGVFPKGIDTPVGKMGTALSGGQRALVQLLRVLLSNPEVIVLDEVTASLDAATKEKVFAVLNHVLRGKTVVMVTHDERLLKEVDRVVDIRALKGSHPPALSQLFERA